jgi:predicted kinase
MNKIMWIMRGLPGSGKSTKAKMIADSARQIYKCDSIILSTDDIISGRNGEGYLYCPDYHAQAHALNQLKAREACKKGIQCVIIDNTNTKWDEMKPYFAIAKEFDYNVKLEEPDTDWKDDPNECFHRTTHNVPLKTIEAMAKRYQPNAIVLRSAKMNATNSAKVDNQPLPPNPQKIDSNLPWAIICDLDGTLALFEKTGKGPNCRSPYDASRCDEVDIPNKPIQYLLDIIEMENERITKPGQHETNIILMSGRESKYRPQTERWLSKHSVSYDQLIMRAEGDRRKDSIIKRELYEKHIRGKYNVRFVLDDRDQVVKMWREELKIPCFQVAYGDF